jgi:hypothetical protein
MDIREDMSVPADHNHIDCLLYNIADFDVLHIVYKCNWVRNCNSGPRHNDIDCRFDSMENDDERCTLGKCSSLVCTCNFHESNCIVFRRVPLVKTLAVSPLVR